MKRITFRCPECAETILAPSSLAGNVAACPKCRAVVAWPEPPASDKCAKSHVAAPTSLPVAIHHDKLPAPPGMIFTCVILTTASVVTIMMPCIWYIGVPLAASAAVAAIYVVSNHKRNNTVVVCLVASTCTFAFGAGYSIYSWINIRAAASQFLNGLSQ